VGQRAFGDAVVELMCRAPADKKLCILNRQR
jgi:hypothetical protein